ncbi:MAG: ATP-dependent RNA helicase RhlE [Bacteroidetes bacterium]|nr:MAG: ATP-dependent RNA helicase RhlE [Bacteroidota bacterium]
MNSFEDFNINRQLSQAVAGLGFDKPTPIQAEAFPVILSGRDVVGIAQTGTGKTLAYMLPVLQDLKFSKQEKPRVLVLVPTRELVLQVTEQIGRFSEGQNLRVLGVYGGVNINTQKIAAARGTDILVATPGRLYDLALSGSVQLNGISKLVIDEVDVMLDLGFRFQLKNIFELMPERRQNIMFSATMTEEVSALIDDFFTRPVRISIAVSGTPLHNIAQQCCAVPNFNTKVNLLTHLVSDRDEYRKVLVFVSNKKRADRLFEALEKKEIAETGIIHSNKTQSFRINAIRQFDQGNIRVLVTTDVMARGLDLDRITHVINFDTPEFPENYMHRIGRTGRAEQQGNSILFYTARETPAKEAIETLMSISIPVMEFPEGVAVSAELIPEERPRMAEVKQQRRSITVASGPAFHAKKEKNLKTNQGGSYKRELAKKYKKPKSKGDKNYYKHFKKK